MKKIIKPYPMTNRLIVRREYVKVDMWKPLRGLIRPFPVCDRSLFNTKSVFLKLCKKIQKEIRTCESNRCSENQTDWWLRPM